MGALAIRYERATNELRCLKLATHNSPRIQQRIDPYLRMASCQDEKKPRIFHFGRKYNKNI